MSIYTPDSFKLTFTNRNAFVRTMTYHSDLLGKFSKKFQGPLTLAAFLCI